MPSNERLEYLFKRNLDQLLNEEERKELLALIALPKHKELVEALISQSFTQPKEIISPSEATTQSILETIYETDAQSSKVITLHSRPNRWYWVAAAILLVLASSLFYLNQHQSPKTELANRPANSLPVKDVVPGGNKAMLTLEDGSVIVLDSAANGMLAQQGNTKISKLDGGSLAYSASENSKTVFNTVVIPRGGQYQLQLADGTVVWLNAASSLRFPTAFTGDNRTVELTGEAYFEVAHDKKKPFHVKVNDMEVEVLGTHFNIMAYAEEKDMRTTLLEGAVNVKSKHETIPILPNQQAIVHASGTIEVAATNAEESIAWKNGLFQFNGNNLEEFMRQIERWYDTKVVYAGKIPVAHFSGTINRNMNLSQIVKILEANEVPCKIEEGRLIVL